MLQYRNSEFKINSFEFETKRHADAVRNPNMSMDKFFSKEQKWPMLTAALGTLDKECFESASKIDEAALAHAPDEWQTLDYNNELYILSTRIMTATELKLGRVHRRRFTRTFGIAT